MPEPGPDAPGTASAQPHRRRPRLPRPRESPFSIKNLLNGDHVAAPKPQPPPDALRSGLSRRRTPALPLRPLRRGPGGSRGLRCSRRWAT